MTETSNTTAAATATTGFQGYWPSSSRAPARTRVRGFDEPPEAASGSPAAPSSRTPSGPSCSYGETASGRQKVTNLRLPGQYDERLFAAAGISGMQGPYYNWNRWYLPSMGRYMELDPIALAGGFNGFYGPNWYGYAEGNPLRYTDRTGRALPAPAPAPPTGPVGPTPNPVFTAFLWGLWFGNYVHQNNQTVNGWFQNAFDYWLGAPGTPGSRWYSGPKPTPGYGPRPAPPSPVPSEEECDEEWARARKACMEWLSSSDPCVRKLAGGYKSVDDCAAGDVREVCGGNKLDWGPNGPFGP